MSGYSEKNKYHHKFYETIDIDIIVNGFRIKYIVKAHDVIYNIDEYVLSEAIAYLNSNGMCVIGKDIDVDIIEYKRCREYDDWLSNYLYYDTHCKCESCLAKMRHK